MIKSNLDTRICDCCHGAKNAQTYREFIRETEKEFGLLNENIDEFTNEGLEGYLEYLNYLWDK